MLGILNVVGINMIVCLCYVCVIELVIVLMILMKSGVVSKSSLLLLMMINFILKDKVINLIDK